MALPEGALVESQARRWHRLGAPRLALPVSTPPDRIRSWSDPDELVPLEVR